MARKTLTAPVTGSGAVTDLDPATLTGVAAAGLTLGGATFVGAALLPGQVFGGTAVAGTCLALGEVKRRTGSYLPFLGGKDDDTKQEPTPVVEAAAS